MNLSLCATLQCTTPVGWFRLIVRLLRPTGCESVGNDSKILGEQSDLKNTVRPSALLSSFHCLHALCRHIIGQLIVTMSSIIQLTDANDTPFNAMFLNLHVTVFEQLMLTFCMKPASWLVCTWVELSRNTVKYLFCRKTCLETVVCFICSFLYAFVNSLLLQCTLYLHLCVWVVLCSM